MAKRKLLWGGAAARKEAADAAAAAEAAAAKAAAAAPQKTANSWEKVEFAQDDSGTQASKFLRLMGMKNAGNVVKAAAAATDDTAAETDSSAIAKRAQMFSNMERQYEAARKVTHNAKGKGFGSAGPTAQKKYF